MVKATHDERQEMAARLEEIVFAEIKPLIEEARDLCEKSGCIPMPNAEVYVFEQLEESLENCNPYNQSLNSLATDIRNGGEDEEG